MSSSMNLQKQPHQLKRSPHIKRYRSFYLIMIVLIISSIGSYWLDGKIFKHNYMKLIESLNTNMKYSIKVLSYREGWFHSSAKLFIPNNVTLNPLNSSAAQNDNKTGLIIEQNIAHGPFAYNALEDKHLFTAGIISSTVLINNPADAKNQQKVLDIISNVSFGNRYNNHIKSHAVDITNQSYTIKWQGVTGNFDFDLKNNHIDNITIELAISPVNVKHENYQLNLATITLKRSMKLNSAKLWDGDQFFNIPQASFMTENQTYNLSNFNYFAKFGIHQKDTYNYTTQLTIAQLILPEAIISPMQMDYSIYELNAQALADFIKTSAVLQNKSSISNTNTEALINSLTKLLTPETNVTFNMLNNTSFGKASVNATADWPENIPLPDNIQDLQSHARVRISIVMPVALVEDIINKYYNKNQPVTPAPQPTEAITPLQSFDAQIEQLETDNKISTSAKTKIASMANSLPSTETFLAYIDQLVATNDLDTGTADILKEQYTTTEQAEKDRAAAEEAQKLAPPPVAPLSPQDRANEQIKTYKNMGYLLENNGNYIATITYENGQLKINDTSINR
jgi:hypothetical protein